MEFCGVMRFFIQGPNERCITKCLRVSSSASSKQIIEELLDKVQTNSDKRIGGAYSIWEIHENGRERCLQMDEKPLILG